MGGYRKPPANWNRYRADKGIGFAPSRGSIPKAAENQIGVCDVSALPGGKSKAKMPLTPAEVEQWLLLIERRYDEFVAEADRKFPSDIAVRLRQLTERQKVLLTEVFAE